MQAIFLKVIPHNSKLHQLCLGFFATYGNIHVQCPHCGNFVAEEYLDTLCQDCIDAFLRRCERCDAVFNVGETDGCQCKSCEEHFCEDCQDDSDGIYICDDDYYCELCIHDVDYFYCSGCDEPFYMDPFHGAEIDNQSWCTTCVDEYAAEYFQCSSCEENYWNSDKKICEKCGGPHCENCKHQLFPKLCDNCDREVSSDEDESIQITSHHKVTEQESNNCWICQQKIWTLRRDKRRLSKWDLKCKMCPPDTAPGLFTPTTEEYFAYCQQNNIIPSPLGHPWARNFYYRIDMRIKMPFPEMSDNKSKTMINACECGPCHAVCLYKLRRADWTKFRDVKNKKMLYRRCVTCKTKWKPELYYMFCDKKEFNSDMDEKDKHNARATLAVVQAENAAAASDWLKFSRQDEMLKWRTYALTNNRELSLPEDVVYLKLNTFLEKPKPQPSAARLLKENREVQQVQELFDDEELCLPGAYRAADFLKNSLDYFIPDFGEDLVRTPNIDGPQRVRFLMKLLHQPNKDYFLSHIMQQMEELDKEFNESLPLSTLSKQWNYDEWKLMKQHYDLVGFFESLQGQPGNTNINYSQLVHRLRCFEKLNQGESKS